MRTQILSVLAIAGVSTVAQTDTYPKNPDVDVQHYIFRLTSSDTTDEILAEATVDVRFRGSAADAIELCFDDAPAQREVVEMGAKRKSFTIAAVQEPSELVPDPDTWVLMHARPARQ